ncbi:alginate O-acetyltransferase AlgX-related protein [Nannocystis pusilla]|uniref:alginate O-acetyltransferase AlgX-related protein n=1 Tax=Nannocystis pusilla TaxID=889268 RepID=UPI003B7CAEFB
MCDEYGAELVVVALPIDVQVDPGEWAKYDVSDAPDMQDSLILLDDLVADATALGLRAVDVTAALRSAQPGAFLDHDIHMTAKGHAAFATALADRLKTPLAVPLEGPQPGLPRGARSCRRPRSGPRRRRSRWWARPRSAARPRSSASGCACSAAAAPPGRASAGWWSARARPRRRWRCGPRTACRW